MVLSVWVLPKESIIHFQRDVHHALAFVSTLQVEAIHHHSPYIHWKVDESHGESRRNLSLDFLLFDLT